MGMPSDYARWRPEFERILDPERYTIDHVDLMVSVGHYVMDTTPRAAILTERKDWPTGKWETHGILAAGHLGDIVHVLIPLAEERARKAGAIAASIASRPGWAKVLESSDYAVDQVTIRKRFAGKGS